jgi:predicted nucleotidyltransferase
MGSTDSFSMNQEDVQMPPPVEEHAEELKELCLRYGVGRLELFGSAATGEFKEGESDLDFLVEFLPEATTNYADNYFGLLEGLQELYGRPADLVVARAIRNPYFRQSVETTKTLIYAA